MALMQSEWIVELSGKASSVTMRLRISIAKAFSACICAPSVNWAISDGVKSQSGWRDVMTATAFGRCHGQGKGVGRCARGWEREIGGAMRIGSYYVIG
jgi:hypothetical protein